MIDDTSLFGVYTVKKDAKNRIILPSGVKAEKGEELVLMMYKNYYKIVSKYYLENLVEEIERDINASLDSGDDVLRRLRNDRDRLLFSALRVMSVDAQSRVNIGNEIYENDEFLKVVGCRNGVYLMTEIDYEAGLKEGSLSL